MDPPICEFIAENELIQIVPNFNDRLIHLISGDFGPFEAGSPVTIPVWLAMHLKGKYKCTIVPPEWLNIEELKKVIVAESEKATFAPVPNCFFELAHMMIARAADDLDHVDQLKTLVKDIQDKREAKMRTSVIKFMEQFQNVKGEILQSGKAIVHPNAQLNNLTRIEISYFRAALSEPSKKMDQLYNTLHSIRLD